MFGTSIFKGSCSKINISNLGTLDIPVSIRSKFTHKCKFNEPMFVVMGHYNHGNSLTILVRETDYESFYNLKKSNYNIHGFSVQAFVRHGEQILLEERADWLDFNPGRIGFLGGIVKSSNLKGEIIRECQEEIGTDNISFRDDTCIVIPEDGLGFLCVLFLELECSDSPPYEGSDEGEIITIPECSFGQFVEEGTGKLTSSFISAMLALRKGE